MLQFVVQGPIVLKWQQNSAQFPKFDLENVGNDVCDLARIVDLQTKVKNDVSKFNHFWINYQKSELRQFYLENESQ